MAVNDIWRWGYPRGGVAAYYRGRLEDQRPLAPQDRERRGEKLDCERGKLECERGKLDCVREERKREDKDKDLAWSKVLVLIRMKEQEKMEKQKKEKIMQLVAHIVNAILSGLAGFFTGGAM